MSILIVSTTERPDLVEITARWRWKAFIGSSQPFKDVLRCARRTAAQRLVIPRTLVLLADGDPVGTASLTAHDLEERPDLTPWLANVFVAEHARHRGHAARLVAAVEKQARAPGLPSYGFIPIRRNGCTRGRDGERSRWYSMTTARSRSCGEIWRPPLRRWRPIKSVDPPRGCH